MDSVTHTLLGACVGEVIAGRKLGKKAMLIGAIANNFPDIDVAASLWMNELDSLLFHRGFTHSFLFVFMMAPIGGWLMKKIFHKVDFSLGGWTFLIGINLLLHIFIDSLTAYGTGWFEPFSHYRVSFNVLFVADPFYSVSLLIACLALLILKRNSRKRIAWASAGLIISSLYMAYAFYHKIEVTKVAEASIGAKKTITRNFIVTPTPLNNFLWYIIAQNDSGYNLGYYSVFDSTTDIRYHFVPRNDSVFETLKNNEEVKKLIQFSQGFYHVDQVKDRTVFIDLRFGQIGGWNQSAAPFVFQYTITTKNENKLSIQSSRWKATAGKAFGEMIERIKGRQSH